jgi:hypothetical protein
MGQQHEKVTQDIQYPDGGLNPRPPLYEAALPYKGTGKFHPLTGHEDPEVELRYSSTLSLTSALDGGGWSKPHPGHFTPGKEGCLDPMAGLEVHSTTVYLTIFCESVDKQAENNSNWKPLIV